MRKLDHNEFKICQALGRIFEKSTYLSNLSSPLFIKRFMNYDGNKCFYNKSYIFLANNDEDFILGLNNLNSKKENKIIYTEDQMYWIGYIYGAITFLYNLNFKAVHNLFPGKEVVKYYNIYHTFDIETAAERMMENIDYNNEDLDTKTFKIMKRMFILDKLKELLGKEVTVYVDRPINSIHPGNPSFVYKVNYGYIKEFKSLDNEYQDAYILGVNEPIKEFTGKVISIISRKNDIEDKLVVSNKEFSKEQIKELVNFQEKYYKSKII